MSSPSIEFEQQGPVRTVWLARPDLHNAFDSGMIAALHDAFEAADAEPGVRVMVLAARGRSFCAGADLEWMKSLVDADRDDNLRDSLELARLFRRIATFSKPLVGRVHGAAMGGGVGLVSCTDIAIASERAVFALSEVRLGLAPAVISPYVIRRIGQTQARRYFLTGERMDAPTAARLGLVHEVTSEDALDGAVGKIVGHLLAGGPDALRACKRLALEVPHVAEADVDGLTSGIIADLRVGSEGQEGMRAFLGKRAPAWTAPSGGSE
jgi:methylglutaconyl-CoA hydratase